MSLHWHVITHSKYFKFMSYGLITEGVQKNFKRPLAELT